MGSGVQRQKRGAPSPDALFEVLSDRRRRILLELLRTTDAPMAFADAVREVVEREHDERFSELSDDVIENVHVSIHHIHVPKLVTAGLVEYDADRRTLELAVAPDRVVPEGAGGFQCEGVQSD